VGTFTDGRREKDLRLKCYHSNLGYWAIWRSLIFLERDHHGRKTSDRRNNQNDYHTDQGKGVDLGAELVTGKS